MTIHSLVTILVTALVSLHGIVETALASGIAPQTGPSALQSNPSAAQPGVQQQIQETQRQLQQAREEQRQLQRELQMLKQKKPVPPAVNNPSANNQYQRNMSAWQKQIDALNQKINIKNKQIAALEAKLNYLQQQLPARQGGSQTRRP